MDSFTWKNQDSYLDYGIVINKKPPISKAERNVDEVVIQGRDGDLTIDYGTYKPISFPMTCTLLDNSKIDEIKAWLDGFDKLIFSWQNYKYYKAKLINKIDIAQNLEAFGEFQLIFKAQPHAYDIDSTIITLNTSGIILNPGNATSNPIIKIYGTGSIDLTINDTVINLTNIDGYVTIDSELMDCYKDTVLMNGNMTGEFPELILGNNIVNWNGTVIKVEITPNWRWS